MFQQGVKYIRPEFKPSIYLEGGGTLGERDRARLISADREQWLDDMTCSGTDSVELWKSLPFGR